MALVELNAENFDQHIISDGIALVDCWAPWCGSCRQFTPIFNAVADDNPDHTFARLNTQDESGLTAALGIKHVPSLVLFRDGLLLHRHTGSISKEGVQEMVTEAAKLDMDDVRARTEEAEDIAKHS